MGTIRNLSLNSLASLSSYVAGRPVWDHGTDLHELKCMTFTLLLLFFFGKRVFICGLTQEERENE